MVAARLTEDPDVRVLLLEAGRADDDDNIHDPARVLGALQDQVGLELRDDPEQKHLGGRRAYWPRMKALGGCSSMNAMIYIRGNHADYDEWRDAYGATGWGFDDVLPYFVRPRATPASVARSTAATVRCTSRTELHHELSHGVGRGAVSRPGSSATTTSTAPSRRASASTR